MGKGADSWGFGGWTALLVLAFGVAGCLEAASDETDATDATDEADEEADDQAHENLAISHQLPGVRRDRPIAGTTTIHDIQRPRSAVTPGSLVTVDSLTIKVTAVATDRFWMQEAGASGMCDDSADAVRYRGITVMPSAPPSLALAIGQRVRVTGVVAELDGNTTLIDADVTAIGEPSEPYPAQCDREGSALLSEALEGVLVLTAGTTDGYSPEGATWEIAPCYATEETVSIGTLLYTPPTWSPSWHWVRGVVVEADGRRELMPRDADDVMADMANDVCL